MEYLYYQRITKIGNGSLEAYWDLAKDYHHFMHAHRKHFKNVFILHEDENTQVMFYQSRIFYPLPFIKNYISCKYLDHDNWMVEANFEWLYSKTKCNYNHNGKPF